MSDQNDHLVRGELDFWESRAQISEQVAHDAIAASEDAWSGAGLRDSILEIERGLARRNVERVLDLGCGMGRLTIPLAAKNPSCSFVGVDISPTMIERARIRSTATNISWRVCDGRSLPEAEYGKFDFAYSMITMQHIPSVAQLEYIRQIGRLLRQGGVFRFQILEGVGESFMYALLDQPRIEQACTDVNLKLTAFDKADYQPDSNVTVRWVTLEK